MYQVAICSTLNNVPITASALQKSRLPFAIHLYPFACDETIPISQDGIIVRCGMCRAYINPYVRISDHKTWQCNLCNRLNELPNQFIYDYNRQQYYDLGSKVELTTESIEYLAGQEYTLRTPQAACYLFVFDCSKAATDLGYIPIIAKAIADSLESMPGDARATIGFIAYDSNVHYFSFTGTQVVHYVVPDISTEILPCSMDGILVNMTIKRDMIIDFLVQTLPTFPFETNYQQVTDTRSALGPALKAAIKILSPIGGKITIIQAQIPNHGNLDDGSILLKREDPATKKNMSSDKNGDYVTPLINPASDFYKNLALECCEHQISVDLFNLSTSYVDLASLSQISKFSAGSVYHYSNTINEKLSTLVRFNQDFRYNLVRQVGLEAVLRFRYSRGLKINTFHGNFFVRSHNLIVLPNANPDASYGFQVAIEDDLRPDTRFVFFQASLLYTTPEGERRVRVHTARYPTVATLPEVIYGANQTAIIAMLAKMAVDRSLQASIGEAKEALIGAGVDLLEIYAIADEMRARSYAMGLPENLRLVPLYILALLKHLALKISSPIKLDDRTAAMERFKTLPVDDLITYIYPDLLPVHNIENDPNDEWKNPLQLSAAHIERNGAYLLDSYDTMIIYICEYINPRWCYQVFGVNDYVSIPEQQDIYPDDNMQGGSYQNNQPPRPRDPANFMANPIMPTYGQQSQKNTSPDLSRQLQTASAISERPLVNLPELENTTSIKLREYINFLLDNRPQKPRFFILKENSRARNIFTQYLYDDRSENYHSYGEFWRFLQDQSRK